MAMSPRGCDGRRPCYFIGARIVLGKDEAAPLRLRQEKRGDEVEPEDLSRSSGSVATSPPKGQLERL
jgi:hypothetical protein